MAKHTTRRVILIHPDAPAKPDEGAACNGCGVCCAAEPCPLGVLLSLRFSGTCEALTWHETERRYTCGALSDPQQWLRWLPRGLARRLVSRWIAASRGCDSDLQAA